MEATTRQVTLSEQDHEALSAIRDGAIHGFDVFVKTSLSLYETSPLLARLEEAGLITCSPVGVGRRPRYALTAAGLHALRVGIDVGLSGADGA